MDLSFSTSAGEGAWSLEECSLGAVENGFDAVRLNATGVADPEQVLSVGPAKISDVLNERGIYLAALSAHSNLLHDDAKEREAAAEKLTRAVDAASLLGSPVVVTHAGSPVSHHFYGTYSYPPGNPTDRSAELVDRFKEMYGPIVDHSADRPRLRRTDGKHRL